MRLAAVGLIVDTPGGLATARTLSGLLFGVGPKDPLTFTSAVALSLASAAVACYLPVRRVSQIDPC